MKKSVLEPLNSLRFTRSSRMNVIPDKSPRFNRIWRITSLLLIMFCCVSNTGYAYVGNWYSQGATNVNIPGSWNSAADGSGITAIPSDATTAGNTWNIQSAMTMSADDDSSNGAGQKKLKVSKRFCLLIYNIKSCVLIISWFTISINVKKS